MKNSFAQQKKQKGNFVERTGQAIFVGLFFSEQIKFNFSKHFIELIFLHEILSLKNLFFTNRDFTSQNKLI